MKKIHLQRYATYLNGQCTALIKGQIDEGFSEEDLEANLLRDKHARLCQLVNQIIDELTPSTPDFQLREACDQLVGTTLLFISLTLLTVLFIAARHIG